MRNLEIKINKDKINKEFNLIKQGKSNGYDTNYRWNEIILYFQWREFYKKELEMWNKNPMYKGLPLQSWIYLNRIHYINKDATCLTDREILRAFKITGLHIGNSFHSPFYIQQFIKDFNIKSIYDYTGGWGHRLLGSWNIFYIYNDINVTTTKNCINMSNYFNLKDKIFYSNDSSQFTPEEDYEACFSCPPYWNIEIYSEHGAENLSYEEFLQWWKNVVLSACINKQTCKYFAYIINNQYLTDMNNIVLSTGLKLLKIIPLGKNTKNHFQHKCSNSFKGEHLCIFTKEKLLFV